MVLMDAPWSTLTQLPCDNSHQCSIHTLWLVLTPTSPFNSIKDTRLHWHYGMSADMSLRCKKRGFMEPIKHARYHEDAYAKTNNEDDLFEARAFDLCEDSSDAESSDHQTQNARQTAQYITSYGSIKKPTCKRRI